MCHFSDKESEAQRPSTTQLTRLNREKRLTTEVLVQVDGFLEGGSQLVLDEAEDVGEHVIRLQGDEHTAGHIVGAPTEVDAGLGAWQRAVVFKPGHGDLLRGEPGGPVRQVDACARLRSLEGTLQDVRVGAAACKETPPHERTQRYPSPRENKSSASLSGGLIASLSVGFKGCILKGVHF